MIQAKVVADSISPHRHRLTTLEVIMPRYILAEFNTHRILSRNSASSRAIPFIKTLKSVITNPFIPYAFQKEHSGMQGNEYFNPDDLFNFQDFINKAKVFFKLEEKEGKDFDEVFKIFNNIIDICKDDKKTLKEWWLIARDKAVETASMLHIFGITKQLANRIIEPFMYHKVLVSGTEWVNFFNLRCPQYVLENGETYKSRKDCINDTFYNADGDRLPKYNDVLGWLKLNKGQADIHMMFLAEAIYDAINESTPKELKDGEWHIPYGDNFDEGILNTLVQNHINTNPSDSYKAVELYAELKCKISIARCARLSYQTLGDNPEINYEKDLQLYDVLSKSGHWSPFEHVARVMTDFEHETYLHQKPLHGGIYREKGWCRNFKGFIQQRALID